MFSNLYTSDSCTHIETARSVFCIDDADFLPNGFISEAWILSVNQTIAELQRALCLAAARTARNADFETCHLPFGFLNLNCHAVPSVSIVISLTRQAFSRFLCTGSNKISGKGACFQ